MKKRESITITKKGPPININASLCTGCLTCVLRCSFKFGKAFNPSLSAINVKRLVTQDSEHEIAFTEKCDRCGICVRFCPYGALTQTGKEVVK